MQNWGKPQACVVWLALCASIGRANRAKPPDNRTIRARVTCLMVECELSVLVVHVIEGGVDVWKHERVSAYPDHVQGRFQELPRDLRVTQ